MDLVAVLAERVGHLVLHLGLGDVDASRELVVHLLDVLVVTPRGGVGRVEDDGDAKRHWMENSGGIAPVATGE